MITVENQAESLLQDLERRAGALQDCSAALETQLKVMLVQESRGHFSPVRVARIARALALCLRGRGDGAQAGQYGLMADNLEARQGGARVSVAGSTVCVKVKSSAADPASPRNSAAGARPKPAGAFDWLRYVWVGLHRPAVRRSGR